MAEPKRWDKVYDNDGKEYVAKPEYYRALLLLAGIEYESEHLLQNGYTPGNEGIYSQPWLMVITEWGPLTIGWRKNVINIGWRDSKFPDILVLPPRDLSNTHGPGYIHAWGYEEAIKILQELKLQFKREVMYAGFDEPKRTEERKRIRANELQQARGVAECDILYAQKRLEALGPEVKES